MESPKPTGRTWFGPAAKLVELVDEQEHHVGLLLDRSAHGHPSLHRMLVGQGFLESGVAGLAPLVRIEPAKGKLIYRTGPWWPMADLLSDPVCAAFPDRTRASLELMGKASRAIHAAAYEGESSELWSHGGLTPWRLGVTPEGEVLIVGWGLPQLELEDDKPSARSLRHAPPERFNTTEEDFTADLFSLTMIGIEWMLGEPLYTGDADTVAVMARRGRARNLLARRRTDLDATVHELLDRALYVHADGRHTDGEQLGDALADLAASPLSGGPGLDEVMAWVEHHLPNGPGALAEAAPEPEAEAEPARWSRGARRPAPAPRAAPPAPRRSRVRDAPRSHRVPPDRNAMYPHEPLASDAKRYRVKHDGESTWSRLDPSESLAKSAARLVDVLEVSPVDLTGRVRGWYRIVQGEEGWYGDAPTSELEAEVPVELEWIANRMVAVNIEHPAGVVQATVGTAVHAQFLVGELRRQLELAGVNWQLVVDGKPVGPWQVLDDFELSEGETISIAKVRRQRRERRK